MGVSNVDNDHRLLLRQVIKDNKYGNFKSIVPCGGWINIVTPSPQCVQQGFAALANHLHVDFTN